MSEKNRAKEYYINNRDFILNRGKEYYINNKESIKKDPKIKDYLKEYRKNMTDEQKQRYKENRNKCSKDITDKGCKEELNNEKIIVTIIKDNDHFNDVIKL